MDSKVIKCPHKVENIFPYGEVLVPDVEELKEKLKDKKNEKIKSINVLSLFDGISCGQVALEKCGIKINKYFASEIDKYCIQITHKNYPNTIQIGDVINIKSKSLPKIDLLIGGSPCQDLSISKKNRQGLQGKRSCLFFEYVKLLKKIKPKYFLLENVNSMSKGNKQIITDILKVEPVMINSALLSAQNRKRLYWIGKLVNGKYKKIDIKQPEDKGILLKDILDYSISNFNGLWSDYNKSTVFNKSRTIGAGCGISRSTTCQDVIIKPVRIGKIGKGGQGDRVYSIEGKSVSLSAHGGGRGAKTGLYCIAQRGRYNKDGSISQKLEPRFDGKTNTLTSVQKDNAVLKIDAIRNYVRKLTPLECERLQTLPDDYTKEVSNTQRYKMIGNGWTVNVIAYIFKEILK